MATKSHDETRTSLDKRKADVISILEEIEKEAHILLQRLDDFKAQVRALQTEEDVQAFIDTAVSPDEGLEHILLFVGKRECSVEIAPETIDSVREQINYNNARQERGVTGE